MKIEELAYEQLANIFLGERLPIDIVDARDGRLVIPANKRITVTVLKRAASVALHLTCATSPILNALRGIQLRIISTPGSVWIVLVESRREVIRVAADGSGFYVPGQETCWSFARVTEWVRPVELR